jgi:hypothetical protein
MNSYQLKQRARSRRNNAQKVQRPLLNFKASKDKAKDKNQEDIYRGDNEVISDHASSDDNDDMDDTFSDSQGSNRSSFDYRSDESDCSFESKLKLVENIYLYVFVDVSLGFCSLGLCAVLEIH